jgi:purine-binding chemotaxis protein CheW
VNRSALLKRQWRSNINPTAALDFQLRAGHPLPAVEYNKFTVIVIATVGDKTVGLLVDAVSDVLLVANDDMREAPDFGSAVDTRFINGVFESREHLTVALNLEELLTECELAVPHSIAA